MRSYKKFLSMILAIVMLVAMVPAPATGATEEEITKIYHEDDYTALKNFLEQDSAVQGKKNGDMINETGYDPMDPSTWTGVVWNTETPKKVVSIGKLGEWSFRSLAGDLKLINFSQLKEISIGNNRISSLMISNSTALTDLVCSNNDLTYIEVYFIDVWLRVTAENKGNVELYLKYSEEDTQALATAVPKKGASLERWIMYGEIPYENVTTVDLWRTGYYRAHAVFSYSEEVPTYTVTFNPNGGMREGGGELVQIVEEGGSAEEPSLYRIGFYYSWDKSFRNVYEDMTVNAIWYPEVSPYPHETSPTPIPPTPTPTLKPTPTSPPPSSVTPLPVYAVTFDPNGGERTEGGALKQYVPYEYPAKAPKVVREGYTFIGWDVPFDSVYRDMTVTAIWQPYTVTFDPNGGVRTGGGELIQSVEAGAAALAPVVVYDNHVFDSWDSDFSKVTKDMTIKALWSLKQCRVIFNPDGGTRIGGGELEQLVAYGGAAEEPELVKDGYRFEDWDMDYSNISDDLIITALWESISPEAEVPDEDPPKEKPPVEKYYSIRYDLNGGKGEAPVDGKEYVKGDVAKLADGSGLGYDNYTFLGWALSPNGKVLTDDTIIVKKDLVLYAIWEEAEEAVEAEEVSGRVPKTGDLPGMGYTLPLLLSGSALLGMDYCKKRRNRRK